jgi:two-component system, LytTR family, response regulator
MIRALIIDDEEAGSETLRILISRYPEWIRVVAVANQPETGITLIEDYKPDLVFLDISMPGMNGFELLSLLHYRDFKLVFTTAHKEFALEAIKNRAYDYLLKPIAQDDFQQCIEKLMNERDAGRVVLQQPVQALLEVLVKDGIIYIKQKEIVRLEASRSYTIIHLDNGEKHVGSKSLIEYEGKLDPELFYRCHKSHLINLQKVQKFVNHDGFFVKMSDGSMPDVSKSHKDMLLERLRV